MFGLSGRAGSVYKTCERQAARDTARGEANFPDSGVSKREYRISCGCEHPFFFSLSLFPLRVLFLLLFFSGNVSVHCNVCVLATNTRLLCARVGMNRYVTSKNGERIEVSVIPKLSDRRDVVELGEFNNVDAEFGQGISPRSTRVFINDDDIFFQSCVG